MNINLTPILQALIGLLAALITYRLVPWIKANTNLKQQSFLHAAVQTAVFAAEQIYGAGNGEEKFKYVCDQLAAKGYDIDKAEIEAAVYTQFNRLLPGFSFAIPEASGPLPSGGEVETGGTAIIGDNAVEKIVPQNDKAE